MNSYQSVMAQALGNHWDELENVVKLHYSIVPGQSCRITVKGVMDEVYHSPYAKLFLLPARLFGALVPYKGKHVPTEVRNWSTPGNTKAMFWHRTLRFEGRAPHSFASRMEHYKDDEIIEYVRYGIGVRLRMSVREGALVFQSLSHVWKVAGMMIKIPDWLLLGSARITEKAMTDDQFQMDFEMIHPLFGRTFAYSGVFSIAND